MADDRDFYAILQVNRNATLDEIERAHERLSRTYDPETSSKPRAAQRHADVQEAFEVLSDRAKRREYDGDLRRGEREVAGAVLPSDVLSNRFVIAAALTLVASVIAVLAVVILVGGDGDENLVANPTTPAVTPTPAPTVPAHTPGVPPESPPEIAGEEITTESGLVYIDFEPGTGEVAQASDTVAVNYSGWLQETGELFDSSISRTAALRVVIGAGGVIAGWDEGLQGMTEGGSRRLIIPGDLAYGEAGNLNATPPIPPNATLIFDVELVDILIPAPPATPTPVPTPTLPAQTPGVPDENPPDVTGEEVTLESGLTYIDFQPGAGEVAQTGDTVAVNYTGWLQDTGAMFDSSISREAPLPVTIGFSSVIQGWHQGLPGLAEGGSRRLIIPGDLAYGEAGNPNATPPIPPGATLIFDIVLVDILTAAAPATETPTPAAESSP